MKLVRLARYKFIVEPRYYYFGWSKLPHIVGRPTLVKALVRARTYLPKGYNFKVWDCQRPRYVQLAMIASFRRRLKLQHPRATPQQISKMVTQFAAKPLVHVPRFDTHRHGGAIDLTIVDRRGNELYMGTDHDDLTVKAAAAYYEGKPKLSPPELEARRNRRILVRVMKRAGFENYAPEWWHWSFPRE
jgi:D-alanyl-D-alanine dipeptidase